MKNSGYSRKQAREAIVCGLLGTERKIKRRARQGQKFHRKGSTTLLARTRKKLTGKTNWFKNKKKDEAEDMERRKETMERRRCMQPGEKKPIMYKNGEEHMEPMAVIHVPCTPNSGLIDELREGEAQMTRITGVRFKFEEKAGMQLSRVICKTDPWAGQDCERVDCPMCETTMQVEGAKGQDCSKRNVLYLTWCQDCKDRDEKKAIDEGRDPGNVPLYKYLGESARSSYERGIEHQNDRRLMSTGSHMMKHLMKNHREEDHDKIKFRMCVLKYHCSAYERHIHESVAIQNARQHHHILNSRAKYNRCALPRLTLQIGEKDYKKHREEELEEMEKEKALNKEIETMKRMATKRKDNTKIGDEGKSSE